MVLLPHVTYCCSSTCVALARAAIVQDICRVAKAMSGDVSADGMAQVVRIRPKYIVEEMRWRMMFGIEHFEPDKAFKKIADLEKMSARDHVSRKDAVPASGGHHFSGWPCVEFTGRHFKRKDSSKAIEQGVGNSGGAFQSFTRHLSQHPCSILTGENVPSFYLSLVIMFSDHLACPWTLGLCRRQLE